MTTGHLSKTPKIYQLKIVLLRTKPPIWRRVQVPASITLGQLHEVIQASMGWTDTHLHGFRIGTKRFGPPDPEWDDDNRLDETKVRLSSVLSKVGDKALYDYDYGDDWNHSVAIEKVLMPEAGVAYPVCIGGKRSCPPEDCGGVWGYANLLQAIEDPENAEDPDVLDWVRDDFDPEEFSVEVANEDLKSLRENPPAPEVSA